MMNNKTYLTEIAAQNGLAAESLQLPDCEIDPAKIRVIMISEVPPKNPADGFYSTAPEPDYMRSALGLFAAAGVRVKNMRDLLDLGIYFTTAVKSPKTEYTVDPGVIQAQLPLLKAELSLFPNLKVIMLMGDVAKKAVNMIVKAETKKNVIPSGATSRLRQNEYYWGGIRVFPSYIMTGKNLLIEPFKRDCVADDIRRMKEVIK
jgi:uracil-DNA glycosylase